MAVLVVLAHPAIVGSVAATGSEEFTSTASSYTCQETSSGYKFCIEEYSIADSSYEPGQTVSVDVTIDNRGDQIGTVEATLGVQDTSDSRTYPDVKTIEISKDEQRTLSLEYTIPDDASSGTYDVTVDLHPPGGSFLFDTTGYTKTFNVNRPPSSSANEPADTTPTINVGQTLTFETGADDPDGDLDGVDWYVDGSFVENHALSGGSGTDTLTRTFSSSGTYVIEADVYDEKRTYNDQAAKWTVEVQQGEPDLTVTNVEVDPSSPSASEPVEFRLSLKNQGNKPVGTIESEIRIDGELAAVPPTESLDPGESTMTAWTGNYEFTAGSHTITGIVDPDDHISESNEGNNKESTSVDIEARYGSVSGRVIDDQGAPVSGAKVYLDAITDTRTNDNGEYEFTQVPENEYTLEVITSAYEDSSATAQVTAGETTTQNFEIARQLPDLRVTSLKLNPSSPKSGNSIDFRVGIKNVGTVPADTIESEIRVDGSLAGVPPTTQIAPGETASVQASAGYEFSTGTHTVTAVVDPDDEISERNENNNRAQDTVNIKQPNGDLTVDVRHQNGDRAEEVNALVVWQDEVGSEPYKKFENDPPGAIKQKINNLPGDHRYKVNAYINDQFAGATDWVNIKNSDKSSTIRVENPVWIKPTVYYTDGSTPLEDATVKIESHEGTQWRSSTTEEDGLTSAGKLWLFPTNKGHYDVQVYSEGSQVASKTFNSLDSNRELRLVTSVSPPKQIDTSVVGRTVREETEQDGTITVGERTRVGATVRNDGTKMPLRVVFQFDTDGDSEPEAINISGDGTPERVDYDGDGEAEPGIVRGGADSTVVPVGKTQSFGLRYAPETAGDWQMRVVTQAKTDDEWIDAGTSDWDGFDVIETPEMRLTWDQAPPSTVLDGGEFTASVVGEVNSESELCITTVGGVDVTECISVNDEFTESFVIEENDIGGPPNRNYTIQASLTYEEPGAGYLPGIGRKTISTSPVEVRKLSSVAKPTEFPYTDTQETASVRDAFQIQVDRKQLSTDTYNITVTTQKGSALNQLNGQFPPGSQIIVLYNNNNVELQPGVESKIKGKSTSLYVYEEIDRLLTAVSLGKSTTVKILVKKLIKTAVESAAENWVTSMIRFESPPTYKSADNINYFTVDYSADDAPSGRIETFSKHRLSFQVEINDSVNRGNIVIVPDLRGKSNRITGTIGGNIPYQEYRRQIVVPVESDSDSSATLVDDKTTLPSGEFGPGDDVTSTVTVENTGTVEETFHVGYTLTHRGSGTAYDLSPKDVTLAPGATQEVTLSWTVPETTQLGGFETTTAVWLDSTDEGLVGRQDDATETVTVTPDTPEFQNRAVYVWGYAGTLATNDDTANRFFERATDEDINTVFLSWGAFKSVSVSERAAFIKKAHKNNLQVHALIGTSERTAVTNAKKTIPEIIAYNKGRDSAAQFDGIHLDAEPGGADVKSFLDEYRTLLDGVRTDIQSDSSASINSQKMALSAAVGPWWTNNAPTKTKQVVEQSALDYVVVMAYSDTEQEIRNRLSKITSDTDTPYVLAVETQEFTQGNKEDVTYYEEGQQDVKSTLQSIAGASSPGYLGSAYHFYQSSVSTWDALESASLRKTTIEPGDRVTVDTDVVFDDNFPQSSHRSQLRVEFDRQGSAYTIQEIKTITPPGNQLTETSVEWQTPTDVRPGEYQVTISLVDTTIENDDREAVASRSEPIILDQIKLGTLEFPSTSESGVDVTRTVSSREVPPNEQVTVTTEITGVSGAVSTTSSYDLQVASATVQSVTVNGASASPITATAEVGGSVVTLGDVGTDATIRITEELTVGEKTDVTHSITGNVTIGETTVEIDPVSVTVADIEPQSVVDKYDSNDDGTISITELGVAGADFARGELTITELGRLGAEFASSS